MHILCNCKRFSIATRYDIDLRKEDMVLMIYSLDALVMYSRSVVRGGSTYVYEDTESIY